VPKRREGHDATHAALAQGGSRLSDPLLVRGRPHPTRQRRLVYPVDTGSHPSVQRGIGRVGRVHGQPSTTRTRRHDRRQSRIQLSLISEPITTAKLGATTVNIGRPAAHYPKIAKPQHPQLRDGSQFVLHRNNDATVLAKATNTCRNLRGAGRCDRAVRKVRHLRKDTVRPPGKVHRCVRDWSPGTREQFSSSHPE
jgi:hypothetical protein